MKILSLSAENIKRLVAVQITPDADGSMVIVGGDNGAGKSSTLDSIAMALGGKDAIPDQPLRRGASRGKIVVETDELIIERSFTGKGTQLVVKNRADKATLSSPQSILDALYSKVSFDPLGFITMEQEKRAKTLRQLVGIDFAALDTEAKTKYEERTGINRELKAQQARCDQMQNHPGIGKELVTVDAISERLRKANEENASNNEKRNKLMSLNDAIDTRGQEQIRARKEVERIEAELDRANQAHKEAKDRVDEAVSARDKEHAAIQTLVDVDTKPILAELETIEQTNAKIRENAAWQKEQETLIRLSKESQALTDRLEAIENQKADTLAKANFPIPGLSFDAEGGVTFNEVPFDQAGSAEKIRVSVAMGFALQPKLKVALIRDGSLLDDNGLALVGKVAAECGGQCWIERVSHGDECSVIIADGQVEEDRTEAGKEAK